MKKYLIGLMTAICLVGAGCDKADEVKLDENNSAEPNKAPSIEVSMDTVANSVGAFTVNIKPSEGTAYYAYLLTTQELSMDASTLFDYKDAVILNYAKQTSVDTTFTNQSLNTAYYTYAVAMNSQGGYGEVAMDSVFLAEKENPNPNPDPGTGNVTPELELNDEGLGTYVFSCNSMVDGETGEIIIIGPCEKVSNAPARNTYGTVGWASFMLDEGSNTGYLGAELTETEFQLYHGAAVGMRTYQETLYTIYAVAVELDAEGNVFFYQGEYIPFTASAQSNKIFTTDVALAYILVDLVGNEGYADIMTNCMFIPGSMLSQAAMQQAFSSTTLEKIKANRVKAFVENNAKIPYVRMSWTRK